jgi:uncharacterized membrane protein
MSRDGRWFAGSAAIEPEAFNAIRWSAATGYDSFPTEPFWRLQSGVSAANTGRIAGWAQEPAQRIIGRVWDTPGTIGRVAFSNVVTSISDDGSVLSGWTQLGFLNVEINGQVHFIAGTNAVGAGFDMTGDGRWVTGYVQDGSPAGPRGPFRWSLGTGLHLLPTLPGYQGGIAHAISGDGATIAGFIGGFGSPGTFWTWTESGGTVELPLPVGGLIDPSPRNRYMDMNFDGSKLLVSYIGGSYNSGALWLRGEGWVSARDYLRRYGIDIPGSRTISLTSISDDGNRILGFDYIGLGEDLRYWYADVPAPGTLTLLAGAGFVLRRRRA